MDQYRPIARGCGGVMHPNPPANLPKGPLLATKWAKNGVLVGGLRGVKFKKSTFGVQMVHFWGFRTSPDSILATGLDQYYSQNIVFSSVTQELLDLEF